MSSPTASVQFLGSVERALASIVKCEQNVFSTLTEINVEHLLGCESAFGNAVQMFGKHVSSLLVSQCRPPLETRLRRVICDVMVQKRGSLRSNRHRYGLGPGFGRPRKWAGSRRCSSADFRRGDSVHPTPPLHDLLLIAGREDNIDIVVSRTVAARRELATGGICERSIGSAHPVFQRVQGRRVDAGSRECVPVESIVPD